MMKPRILFSLGAVAAAAACVSGTVPARELWRLDPPAVDSAASSTAQPVSGGATIGAPMLVALYETPGLYGDQGITYRVNEARYGTYRARDWAMPLGEMLSSRTAALLRRQRLASVVLDGDAPSPMRSGWRWEGTVREFDEVDRSSGVSVSVALDAVVRRAENDSVVWRGFRKMERPVQSPTMANIVAALSSTSDSVIVALARDAAPALQSSPSTTASTGAP